MDNQKKQALQASGKEVYDNIIIPPELEDVVKKSIESVDKEAIDMQYKKPANNIFVIAKYIGSAAAILMLSFIIGLNSSETFAREMEELPFVGSVARVFTVRNYTVKEDELTIDENVPNVELTMDSEGQNDVEATVSGNDATQSDIGIDSVSGNSVSGNASEPKTQMTISGNDIVAVKGDEKRIVDTLDTPTNPVTVSSNDVYEQAAAVSDFNVDINAKIENYIQRYVSDETKQFEEYKIAFFENGGTEEEWADRKFDIDVSYEIKSQRGAIVSFVITSDQNWCSTYGEKTYYNLDLLNGKWVVLSDLLGENYEEVANVQIVRQMKQRVNENPDYVYWGVTDEGASQGFDGFTTVDENTKFYINAAGNPVIVFDKYEIAPGFMGEQEFEIVVEKDTTVN